MQTEEIRQLILNRNSEDVEIKILFQKMLINELNIKKLPFLLNHYILDKDNSYKLTCGYLNLLFNGIERTRKALGIDRGPEEADTRSSRADCNTTGKKSSLEDSAIS